MGEKKKEEQGAQSVAFDYERKLPVMSVSLRQRHAFPIGFDQVV